MAAVLLGTKLESVLVRIDWRGNTAKRRLILQILDQRIVPPAPAPTLRGPPPDGHTPVIPFEG